MLEEVLLPEAQLENLQEGMVLVASLRVERVLEEFLQEAPVSLSVREANLSDLVLAQMTRPTPVLAPRLEPLLAHLILAPMERHLICPL